MPQAMATGGDPRGFGIALHFLLDSFHGERPRRALAIPKHIAVGSFTRMLLQAPLHTGDGIGRQIDAPIFAPFALRDLQGLLLPVNMGELELRRLRDAQPAAEHHQTQGPIHRMVDLGKQPLDLLPGERFRQGPPTPDERTGLDGIALDQLLVETHVKKMPHGIEPSVDGRPRSAVLMLVLHKPLHLTKGDLREGDSHLRTEETQIEGLARDGVRRELSALQVGLKPVNRGLTDGVHGLSPLQPLACFDLRHGLVVWGPLGPVIELGIAEGDVEGAVPHELFDDLQRGPGIEELGSQGLP